MSFKKCILSLLFVGLSCSLSAAYAEDANSTNNLNSDTMDNVDKLPLPIDYTGVYVDLSLGYASVNWADATIGAFNGFDPAVTGSVTGLHKKGGAGFGADVGYQINRYLGLEFAWYYLQRVSGFSDITPALLPLVAKSWVADMAVKAMAPIWGKLDVFAKVGPAYRYLRYSGEASILANPGFGGQRNQYWSVMFGAGLQYWLDKNWLISAEYLHFSKHSRSGDITRQAPVAQLFLASIGYKFTLMQ